MPSENCILLGFWVQYFGMEPALSSCDQAESMQVLNIGVYWHMPGESPDMLLRIKTVIKEQRDLCTAMQNGLRRRSGFTSVSYTHLTLPTNREV